ncbi:response regulator transcription factor [Taibaiella koreensis]|uniref:response regulator transcription factor n=1 Tax=Taibaiella koreensis TaxID=1268548 RepID=UPI000E5A09C3|nr:response regulator transcription factor [Taibaiella koreensis]
MLPQILIADDHSIVRHGLSIIIRDILPDAELFFATNFDTLLQVLAEGKLTLAICDVNMPGCNNFHMVQIMKQIQPELKIIIYSAYDENLYANRFIKAGADLYLQKEIENQVLIKAIHSVLEQRPFAATAIHEEADNGMVNPISLLSDREFEVSNLLVKGLGTSEICHTLDLGKTTVSTYKRRIYEKMGISTLPELVTIYRNYVNAII